MPLQKAVAMCAIRTGLHARARRSYHAKPTLLSMHLQHLVENLALLRQLLLLLHVHDGSFSPPRELKYSRAVVQSFSRPCRPLAV